MATDKSIKRINRIAGVEVEITSGKERTILPETEHIRTKRSSQATKPFIIGNYLRAIFSYDTAAAPGDYVRTVFDNKKYMVMNLDEAPTKGKATRYYGILYLVNAEVTIQRQTKVWNAATYKYDLEWASIDVDHENVPCLISGTRFGNEILPDGTLGTLTTEQQVCYIPRNYSIKQNDRLVFSSADTAFDGTTLVSDGEVLRVSAAQRYNYPNIYEVTAIQDER